MRPTFQNPVALYQGVPAVGTLATLVGGRRFLLVTTEGWVRRGLVGQVVAACGTPAETIDTITENPKLQDLSALEPILAPWRGSDLVVVAIGGGSALDSAKAVTAALAPGLDMNTIVEIARTGANVPAGFVPPPLYCIPTTAGTGSEVTKTATTWDAADGRKYSISDDRLYPAAAILDPTLITSQPPAVRLSAGIDALSHAMESIWSVRHNSVSDALAVDAIARIWRFLPLVMAGGELRAWAELQTAALHAGLAISATGTALAHSISYPLTGRFGLRHGLACGFTLPYVAAFTLANRPDRRELLTSAFGLRDASQLPAALRNWMERLGVYRAVREVIQPAAVAGLGPALLAPGRADNNLRMPTPDDAQAVLLDALASTHPERAAEVPARGRVIWITGLSGSGKSTLGRAVTAALRTSGEPPIFLDGDELRAVIGGRLGYGVTERRELAFRYSALCRVLAEQGVDVVCATMALFHACQQWNREHIPRYVEVYLQTDVQTLISRDSKSLYSRALRGEVSDVAGIDQAYEEPLAPDLVIDNTARRDDIGALAARVLDVARLR